MGGYRMTVVSGSRYVPDVMVRLPGAPPLASDAARIAASRSVGTSRTAARATTTSRYAAIAPTHQAITVLSGSVHSAVGGAAGGAYQVAGNSDVVNVLQNIMSMLQQLSATLSQLAGGKTAVAAAPPAAPAAPPAQQYSAPAPPAAPAPAAPVAATSQALTFTNEGHEQSSFEQQVVDLVNQQRAAYGIGPLSYNAVLDQAATEHNSDQITTRTMAHHNMGDGEPDQRLQQLGYYGAWGENVAVGQTTPQQVVQEWMNSPTHRANILNPNYHHLGVSYGTTSDGYAFWTQEFGV
jgi:uncharacterized protein YkwD